MKDAKTNKGNSNNKGKTLSNESSDKKVNNKPIKTNDSALISNASPPPPRPKK